MERYEIKPASGYVADAQPSYFTQISNQLIDDERIGALEKALFLLLARHANWHTGMAFPGYRSIVRRLHCSLRSIKPAMANLRALGYVEGTVTQGKRSLYILKMPLLPKSNALLPRSNSTVSHAATERSLSNDPHLTSKSAVRKHPDQIQAERWQQHIASSGVRGYK